MSNDGLTGQQKDDNINTLHKGLTNNIQFVPKKGQRKPLCSNKSSSRCPFLDIAHSKASIDISLDYLASILVQAFLDIKEYERNKQQQ